MSVRAVVLRAGSDWPEWTEIAASASGPELSAAIRSSQPECIELAPRVLLWVDNTPFCAIDSRLGEFMLGARTFIGTGDVLLVATCEAHDSCEDENSHDNGDDTAAARNCDLDCDLLTPLFTAEFLEKLKTS